MYQKTLKLLLVLTFLAAFGPAIFGQSTNMSLSDCIDYGFANQTSIKVAQLQINDAKWRIKENKDSGLPQISAGISYQYYIQRPGIPASALGFPGAGDEKVAFSALHSLSPSLSVNQLFYSNSYRLALRASNFYLEYVTLQMEVAKAKLRNQIVDAYLPALLLSDNLGILDKNIANLEKLLNETKIVNKAGFNEQLDVDRLELSLSTLKSERNNLARQQEMVINALKFTMGMPVQNPLSLSDKLDKLMSEYADAEPTAEVNLMNRPEYLELLKARDLSSLQVELNSKPWMPTVAGFLQYQPGFQGGFGDSKTWYFIPAAIVGLSVNVPIWDGGQSKARKERAIIGVQTLDAQKQLLENAIALELETARKQYANAADRVKSQMKNVELAQRIYDTTQTKFKAGVGSSFEITSAEQALYAAQQNLMQAQFDLLNAKAAIRKALGK